MPKKLSLKFFRDNRQIVYSLTLIVMIPAAIIFNTFVFTNSFRSTIDQSLYTKAVGIASAVNVGLISKFDNQTALQKAVLDYVAANDDIKELQIFSKQGDQFKVEAANNAADNGKTSTAMVYLVAWNKDWPTAQQVSEYNQKTGKYMRYWTVVTPLRDTNGNKRYLLSISISTEIVDALTGNVLFRSYIILLATVIVVILLLAADARLFEYALLYNKIKEVDRMKDEFVSMASHELKTPITVIQGYASMLMENKNGELGINDKSREFLTMMNGSAERLKDLVEDLLNVSRIEQGRLKIETVPTDILPLVEGVVKELSYQAEQKSLKLVLNKPEETLPKVNLDSARFKQVLINIIGNSIKYTLQGSVKVSLEARPKSLVLRVKDTGIGMSASEREHLFEKFYRIKNDKTAVIQGTGLGLWITKQIVELMNGKIEVDSIENVGTQISVEFPIA